MVNAMLTPMSNEPLPGNQEILKTLNAHLLNRRITCITVSNLVQEIHKACLEGRKITVANYNVHSFNLSMQLPWFYEFLQSAEIAHCDGVGILKALQYMGMNVPLQYRSSYTLLIPKLLELCNQQGLSIFLLGSKPEYLEAALDLLKKQYPNIRLAGHHGYFDKKDPQQNEAIIQQINLAKPHILIVGMGMPIQEDWIQRHRHRLNVNVFMPGGAIIDRLAGIVSDCPPLISNMGLEWLYRLCKEPRRLAARYLLGNPAFVLQVALGKFHESSLHVEEMPSISGSSQDAKYSQSNLSSEFATQKEFSTTARTQGKRIGDYLIEAGLVTPENIETALSEQAVTGMRLGDLLVKKGLIKKQTVEFLMQNKK